MRRVLGPLFGDLLAVLLILIGACGSGVCEARGAEPGVIPQWIWSSTLPLNQEAVVLTREFELATAVKSGSFEGLVDDEMVVAINGVEVARVTSSKEWLRTDVRARLKAGRNQISLSAKNRQGAAGACCRLRIELVDGSQQVLVTDPMWRIATGVEAKSATTQFAVSRGLVGIQPWGDPSGEEGDYYQWKQALGAAGAESAATIRALPGFEVELLRSAQAGESSWISLTFDASGDAIIGCEGRDKRNGLLRLKLPNQNDPAISVSACEETLLEPRGLVFKGDALFANANNALTLVKLEDRDRDGRFEVKTELRKSPGSVGHGRNNLCVGPDSSLYSIHGNDVRLPDDFDPQQSRCLNVAVDRLLTCRWDRYLFDWNSRLPAGHLIRTDETGRAWELFACGFRNPYGIDFNTDAEAFTFDADNEGDLGAPWYRPTRINHVIPGGDYGWRQGTGMRPEWYPDSLPATLNIGKSSPTDIKFGTHSKFPVRYQKSLFILDWTYGRIYSIELLPRGASYVGTAELFLEGRPLNVTDLEFGPDGELYFTTGGRGTQSGLYRVRYVGPNSVVTPPTVVAHADVEAAKLARSKRKELEAGFRQPQVAAAALRELSSHDTWLRHAARLALESVPVELWQDSVLKLSNEHSLALVTGLMAISRLNTSDQRLVLARLNELPLKTLGTEEQLIALRAYQLSLLRLASPLPPELKPDAIAALKLRVRQQVETLFPTRSAEVNQFACELLIALESPHVVDQTMPLLAAAGTQEEKLQWLFQLRLVKRGWTTELRRAYLKELAGANAFDGGRELPVALFAIGGEFRTTLSSADLQDLAAQLGPQSQVGQQTSLVPQRPLVREWKLEDLTERLGEVGAGRNLERGQRVFREANCAKCHRFSGEGQPVGPDLNFVGFRFGRRDLLETILVPSKVIDTKYRDVRFELKSGRLVTGRVVGGDERVVLVAPNAASPFETVELSRSEVESEQASPLSPMPVGLLNSFSADEVLDLMAYLEANGIKLKK